jgi:hypothetical protein
MHRLFRRSSIRVSLAFLLVAALAACGTKITEKNYERVQEGMTKEEVESILGAPTDSKSVGFGGFSGGHSTWKAEDGTTITIQFVNGKVASKQFIKPGEKED